MRESEIDPGSNILSEQLWDATELQSPQRQLLEEEEYHPGQDPLLQEDQLEVDIEAKENSMDGLIDEIITINIDKPNLVECAKNAAL